MVVSQVFLVPGSSRKESLSASSPLIQADMGTAVSGLVDTTKVDNRYILCAVCSPEINRQPVIPEQKPAARKPDKAMGKASNRGTKKEGGLRRQEGTGHQIAQNK